MARIEPLDVATDEAQPPRPAVLTGAFNLVAGIHPNTSARSAA